VAALFADALMNLAPWCLWTLPVSTLSFLARLYNCRIFHKFSVQLFAGVISVIAISTVIIRVKRFIRVRRGYNITVILVVNISFSYPRAQLKLTQYILIMWFLR
jgi:hypothetical protein